MYTYIYIYIERERYTHVHVHYTYTLYLYIYIYDFTARRHWSRSCFRRLKLPKQTEGPPREPGRGRSWQGDSPQLTPLDADHKPRITIPIARARARSTHIRARTKVVLVKVVSLIINNCPE